MPEKEHTIRHQKEAEEPTQQDAEALLELYYNDYLYVDGERMTAAETDLFCKFDRGSDGEFYLSSPNPTGLPVATVRVEESLVRKSLKKAVRKRAISVKEHHPKRKEGMVTERRLVEFDSRRWEYQERVLRPTPTGNLHGYWSFARIALYEEKMGFANLLRVAELADSTSQIDDDNSFSFTQN